MDREDLERRLRVALSGRPVNRAEFVIRGLESVGVAKVRALVHVRSYHSFLAGRAVTSDWEVVLEEFNGRWLARSATPRRVAGRSRVVSLRSVIARGY
jgi:hypothetical protein